MPHGSQTSTPGPSITDSLIFRIAMFAVALFLRLVSVAETPDNNTIQFTSPHHFMIVIPVRVNGMGPYSFLLDTGATSSVVDPQLSTSLKLSAARDARISSWNVTADARRVSVESLSVGPIDSGPLSVLVEPIPEFKALDPQLRGILGEDVLLRTNYLIDNRHHRIRFDGNGALLPELTGDRLCIVPVRTRAGGLEPRLISIPVRSALEPEPLHLLLDSGADMVVLQPDFAAAASAPRGTKWIADENGKRSAASSFRTRLTVGVQSFSTEVWVGETGLKSLAIDGLLPTGSFNQIYIANQGSFVIFDPGHKRHKGAQGGR